MDSGLFLIEVIVSVVRIKLIFVGVVGVVLDGVGKLLDLDRVM